MDDAIVIVKMPERIRQALEDLVGTQPPTPLLLEAYGWLRGEHGDEGSGD